MTRILLAGATGAVGKTLTPMLVEAGFQLFGMTRAHSKSEELTAVGATPVVVDVYDRESLVRESVRISPDIVVHQLTDLSGHMDIARNAKMRHEGTNNLVHAAVAAGARRIVAQSIAWAYSPGPEPHAETDHLDFNSSDRRRTTVDGVIALERAVLHTPGLEGVVLRYGQLYGPGTGIVRPVGNAPLHVEDAARAVVLALSAVRSGVFNIAEPNEYVSTEAARSTLGWEARNFQRLAPA